MLPTMSGKPTKTRLMHPKNTKKWQISLRKKTGTTSAFGLIEDTSHQSLRNKNRQPNQAFQSSFDMNNRKLILSTFLLSAIFAVVIKASIQVPGSGGTPEANISNTYIADVAVCESGRDEELRETDKEVSQANSAAVFIAAGCGRRCTLTVIGGPAAVGVCVSPTVWKK